MNRPHQRIGAISNAHVGAAFERVALEYFRKIGIVLTPKFSLSIGVKEKKEHCFDLGSSSPPVLVECKSHRWTEGAKVPSAKMTVWNEAMLYFQLAPPSFRKILFVLHDKRPGAGESLVSYYRRTYAHLIPEDVEFLEFDESSGDILKIEEDRQVAALTAPSCDCERTTISHPMILITPKEIIEFVRSRGDVQLSTLWRKQRFIVRAVKDELEYIPSTGKPRRDMQTATKVCEEFSRTNSPHPGHYSHLSKHASYTLAVIDDYLKKTKGHGILS